MQLLLFECWLFEKFSCLCFVCMNFNVFFSFNRVHVLFVGAVQMQEWKVHLGEVEMRL